MAALNLYLDCEWFIGGDVFLIGWCRDTKTFGQLHDETLTKDRFMKLLNDTTGIIYFYGPDIGIIEKYFDIDIRSNYHCVNLLKVFRDLLPGLKNYKLATIEKLYNLKRNRNEYKANIFSIFKDWRRPQVKSLVLQYNREDVINLALLHDIIFVQKKVEPEYLLQVRLAGTFEIVKDHVMVLPADVYRGPCGKRNEAGECVQQPNITAQMVLGAKFYGDKVSLYRMSVLMTDVAKRNQYDLVTSVNGRDSPFDLAHALAINVAAALKLPYLKVFSGHNSLCTGDVTGKRVLIIDDVLYKGRTMNAAIKACKQQRPSKIFFLVFGKSARNAF